MRSGSQLHFHNALRKYGEAAFDWQIIDEVETEQELNEKEKYWIQFYKSFDPDFGYNLTLGGDGGVMVPEVRKRMRTRKGCVLSEATKKKMSDARKGNPGYWVGKKQSAEHRQKNSSANKTRWSLNKSGAKTNNNMKGASE